MIRYQFFPRSQGITPNIKKVIDCFIEVNEKIDSSENNLSSNAVLKELKGPLTKIGYKVALLHKSSDDRITPYSNLSDGFRAWLP